VLVTAVIAYYSVTSSRAFAAAPEKEVSRVRTEMREEIKAREIVRGALECHVVDLDATRKVELRIREHEARETALREPELHVFDHFAAVARGAAGPPDRDKQKSLLGTRSDTSVLVDELPLSKTPRGQKPSKVFVKVDDRLHVFERKGAHDRWTRINGAPRDEYFKAYLRRRALDLSNGHTTVYSVIVDGATIRILEQGKPDVVVVGAEQLDQLVEGWANRVIVLSVPDFLGPDARKQVRATVNELQRRDPDLSIFVDDPKSGLSARVVEALRRRVADPITVVIPSTKFSIIDGGALQDLSGALRRANVTVTGFEPGQGAFPTNTALIVIAGHSAEELSEYVGQLSKAGAFKGNDVVFASCGTELTQGLIRQILNSGANSLFAFDKEIKDVEVQRMLKSFVEARRSNGGEGLVEHLRRWIVKNGVDGAWEALRMSTHGGRRG